MKQQDVAMIILIVGFAAVVSFFLSRALFQSGDKHQQKAAVVDVITTDFKTPNQQYFNSQSIDPTQLIKIGDSNNQNPFNGSGN